MIAQELPDLESNEQELVRLGKTVEAIKAYRGRTGQMLNEAKKAIDIWGLTCAQGRPGRFIEWSPRFVYEGPSADNTPHARGNAREVFLEDFANMLGILGSVTAQWRAHIVAYKWTTVDKTLTLSFGSITQAFSQLGIQTHNFLRITLRQEGDSSYIQIKRAEAPGLGDGVYDIITLHPWDGKRRCDCDYGQKAD